MLDLEPEIHAEYDRWMEKIELPDPYVSQSTVGITEVLTAHFLIANFFYQLGSGIGGVGPRDLDLLHSAVMRQHVSSGTVRKWDNKYLIAATLFFGLIKNHSFHDANKRTAFLTLLYQLHFKFGLAPSASQKDLEDFAVEVAGNKLEKYAHYIELCNKGVDDPEIRFIARYLKQNTRGIDKRYYVITFHQLRNILRKFGYDLQNPSGNTIDVVRIEERRTVFGFGNKETVGVKVTQIGFPGWTKQVNRGAIQSVRRATNLVAERGVDSATFFHDVDPIDCLIAGYQDPLLRLANR